MVVPGIANPLAANDRVIAIQLQQVLVVVRDRVVVHLPRRDQRTVGVALDHKAECELDVREIDHLGVERIRLVVEVLQ